MILAQNGHLRINKMALDKTTNGKDRSTNFNKDEATKLACLLKEYPIITCKKTDHTSNKQKDAAWHSLAEKFNSDAVIYRNIKQLQQKFNNMKKIARKEMSAEKRGRRQTGGGPPPPKPSETTEWLNTIMGESISGLPAIFDSDVVDPGAVNIDVQIKTNNSIEIDFIEQETLDGGNAESPSLLARQFLNTEMLNDMDTDAGVSAKLFDNSTPKALIRKPISQQLSNSCNKRKRTYTPLEARKRIINHFDEKKDFLSEKKSREELIKKYAHEEHNKNMVLRAEKHNKELAQMEEKHILFITQQKEMHELEKDFKQKMQELLLQKIKLEIEYMKK